MAYSMFSKRFDLIIKLTDVKSSSIAKFTNTSPSYISKLRTGARKLPKNPVFLSNICKYFASYIDNNDKKALFCQLMHVSDYPENIDDVENMIQHYLQHSDDETNGLGSLFDFMLSDNSNSPADKINLNRKGKTTRFKNYYYGIEGKRTAALQLFDYVLEQEEPCTLYLNSEENMAWMQSDKDFIKEWEKKFIEVLAMGNEVVIIHNTKRDINELIYGAAKWSAIYMNGKVKSYYYSGIRDNVLQRTLFIADKLVAFFSLSVNHHSEDMLNEIVTDKNAIAALQKEFKNFLSLCKPLSLSINKSNLAEFANAVKTRLDNKNLYLKSLSTMPTILTMPRSLAVKLQARYPDSQIVEMQTIAEQFFKKHIATSSYTELIQAKKLLLEKKELELPFADFLGANGANYTADDLHEHYQNIELLQQTYPNYQPVYIDKPLKKQLFFSLDNEGFILARPNNKNILTMFMDETVVNTYNNFLISQIEQLR